MEDDAFNPLANYEQVEQFDSDLEEEYEEEEVSHTNPAYWRIYEGPGINVAPDVIRHSGLGTIRPQLAS